MSCIPKCDCANQTAYGHIDGCRANYHSKSEQRRFEAQGIEKPFDTEFIQNYIQKLVKEQESLIAKYLGETGHKPSDICLVERENGTGRIFYPDLKSKYPTDVVDTADLERQLNDERTKVKCLEEKLRRYMPEADE